MKKAILLSILCLLSCIVLAKSDKPNSGSEVNQPDDPNTPRQQIQTKYFKFPLRIGERYRLGGDNVLVSVEKADGGGFIGKLTARTTSDGAQITINVWCKGFGSSKPGSQTRYDRTLTVSGIARYNGVPLFVIEPYILKK